MRKLIQMLIFIITIHKSIYAQSSIELNNRIFRMERVDSSKFDIRGWWMIIDKKYSYNDDKVHNSNNLIKQIYKRKVFFSDNYFYAFTPSLYNFMLNPTYKEKYYKNIKKNHRLTYLQNFFEGLLYVDIFENDEQEPMSSATVLNEDLIAYSDTEDEFVFMERINNNIDGWEKVDDFEIISYNGYSGYNYQYIVLSEEKIKNRQGFLEFIYLPQKSCLDTTFSIKCVVPKKINTQTEQDYDLYTNKNKDERILNDYIELSKIQNNILKIEHENCQSKNEWKFMWRLVDEVKAKKVTSEKALLNSQPNTPTKSFLIKGDRVETLEEKGEWLKIRYYGKKIIEGWIKKSDVEM